MTVLLCNGGFGPRSRLLCNNSNTLIDFLLEHPIAHCGTCIDKHSPGGGYNPGTAQKIILGTIRRETFHDSIDSERVEYGSKLVGGGRLRIGICICVPNHHENPIFRHTVFLVFKTLLVQLWPWWDKSIQSIQAVMLYTFTVWRSAVIRTVLIDV